MKVSGREPRQSPSLPKGSSGSTLQADQSAAGGAASRPGYTLEGVRTAESIQERFQSWTDEQHTLTVCAFCGWKHKGTALEGREQARAHRQEHHPEACVLKPRMRRRISKKKLRSAAENEQIAVDAAEARRVRSERETDEMLAKIEKGRARDRAAQAALDGSAA